MNVSATENRWELGYQFWINTLPLKCRSMNQCKGRGLWVQFANILDPCYTGYKSLQKKLESSVSKTHNDSGLKQLLLKAQEKLLHIKCTSHLPCRQGMPEYQLLVYRELVRVQRRETYHNREGLLQRKEDFVATQGRFIHFMIQKYCNEFAQR